jgi:hypothetical protein
MGYGLGLRYFRCLYWIFGLAAVGVLVLRFFPQENLCNLNPLPQENLCDLRHQIAYSFQSVLPVVTLEKFDTIHLSGIPAVWFYLCRLFGYALAAFLAAGVAGLTQRAQRS